MTDYQTWLEAKKNDDTSKIDCVEDIAKALKKIFDDYSKSTREDAWKKITSVKGKKEVEKLLKNPSGPISGFRKL